MADVEEHIIIPAEEMGEECVVSEVHYSALKRSVTLVTSGWRLPALIPTVEQITLTFPDATTIRVMTSATFNLLTLGTFQANDGEWRVRSPRVQASRSQHNEEQLRQLLASCLLAAAK